MKIVDLISLDLDMGLAVIKGKSKKAGKILPVTLNLEDLEGYAFKCSVCGEIHPISEVCQYECKPICEACQENRFATCQDCGKLIPKDLVKIVNGKQVCTDCYLRYRECSSCGEWHRIEDTEIVFYGDNYDAYCKSCFKELLDNGSVGECSSCGDYFYKNELTKIDGALYCEECSAYALIAPYHQSRPPKFYSINSECNFPLPKNLYIGMEVELSGVGTQNGGLAHKIVNCNYLKCEHDSSIFNGFEIISDAMTLPFWQKNQGGFVSLSKAIELAKKDGFVEHPSSGIHVHFSNTPLTQEQLVNIGVFIMSHYCDCIRFGRRNPDELFYCGYYNPNGITPIISMCSTHDYAINFGNKLHTELRFFATSTNTEHIKAILEFTYALCKTAMTVNDTFGWEDIKKVAEKSGKCPHFLKELQNNFESEEIKQYIYTQIPNRTL